MLFHCRRASENAACNELVVSDICVIMTNRGDQAPHSYCTIDRNLNKNTMVSVAMVIFM